MVDNPAPPEPPPPAPAPAPSTLAPPTFGDVKVALVELSNHGLPLHVVGELLTKTVAMDPTTGLELVNGVGSTFKAFGAEVVGRMFAQPPAPEPPPPEPVREPTAFERSVAEMAYARARSGAWGLGRLTNGSAPAEGVIPWFQDTPPPALPDSHRWVAQQQARQPPPAQTDPNAPVTDTSQMSAAELTSRWLQSNGLGAFGLTGTRKPR
jgi:hypothetical protein